MRSPIPRSPLWEIYINCSHFKDWEFFQLKTKLTIYWIGLLLEFPSLTWPGEAFWALVAVAYIPQNSHSQPGKCCTSLFSRFCQSCQERLLFHYKLHICFDSLQQLFKLSKPWKVFKGWRRQRPCARALWTAFASWSKTELLHHVWNSPLPCSRQCKL